ncbi:MAG: Exopolysaccharide biosynthesis polyprenyl glycosylphosphotransferase [Verrucomicrobiales bacterium]|nr:Exopolysaccharide biosynthesis polyprenyl glycosylphosphotransferase [Verrucomicrobiales bacterium]
MNSNGALQKHWLNVSVHFGIDAGLFFLAFLIGTQFRLGSDGLGKLSDLWPAMVLGALFFSCVTYICNLYSPHSSSATSFRRALILGLCMILTFCFMLAIFYIKYSTRIGRGIMVISSIASYLFIYIHHVVVLHRLKNYRERVALIVTCQFDEMESELFQTFWSEHLELAGFIRYDSYQPTSKTNVLGSVKDIVEIVRKENISRVLCTDKSINDPLLRREFCQLRYSGVNVMPLISLCEEVYQSVPLELISSEWLLNASSLPHMLYIKKIKRAFDIITSLLGLIFLGPFMLLGILAIKLSSPGPVFYYQTRSGRFGKPLKVIKLRTMSVDAEKNGAVWAASKDSRVTFVGGFLRKYRVDEIPQIINVLRGEMSFVGPRPERPEFIETLSQQIPHFGERLMVQPGITGWAQVSYPYGNTVDDAKRKLEYDLYYTKHMSLFLDLFILLDTVRIILLGGLQKGKKKMALSNPKTVEQQESILRPAHSSNV